MANLQFDARHGLTVGNGATSVINSDGNILTNFAGGIAGALIYQSASNVTSQLANISLGNVLVSKGVGNAPGYDKVLLSGANNHVSGILLPENGGTGVQTTTGTPGNLVYSISPTITGSSTFTGDTITGASSPVINLTQTWNTTQSVSGIKFTLTNTASDKGSLILDLRSGSNKFGVNGDGSLIQVLASPNMARDIVGTTGSRHVREYQDLNDASVQGLDASKIEWGFTWNGKWDTTTSTYLKDRNNVNDHAIMNRLTNGYKNDWWFSDGTSPGPISWVNKIRWDFPAGTYQFVGALSSTSLSTGTLSSTSLTVTNDVVIGGDLTVNGTTVTMNTSVLDVEDINITLGKVAVPSDTTANGGGITLLGSTNKTITWNQSNDDWTFSHDVNLVTGKTYDINGVPILSATSLASSVVSATGLTTIGTIGTGVWQGTIIAGQYGGTGVDNSGKTITLGGNISTSNTFSTSGAFALTLTATAATNVTLPSGNVTLPTNNQTMYIGTTAVTINRASANLDLSGITSIAMPGSTSGMITITPVAIAGTTTITIPATSGTLITSGDTGTVTNLMLAGSIANAKLLNSSITIGSTNISLGGTSTALAGLTSVTSTSFVGDLTGLASSATAIAGGNQWGVLYQSSSGVTTSTSAGTSGQVLKSNGTSAPTWITGTISGVALGSNLNILTIGTGLSGTSYNGSAAVTISVNYGTSAITACVGNDARLSDTRNTTNAITFNNGGAGDVSGTTFNGSAVKTISYNTIGAASSGHNHASITGYAAAVTLTADNSTNATMYPLFAGAATGNLSPKTDTALTYNPSTGILTASGFSGVTYARPATLRETAAGTCLANYTYLIYGPAVVGSGMYLPSAPVQGDRISFVDMYGNWGSNVWTLYRNGHRIMGLLEDLTVDVDNSNFTLIYSHANAGWRLMRD